MPADDKQPKYEHVEIAASPESIADLSSRQTASHEVEIPTLEGVAPSTSTSKRLRIVDTSDFDATPLAEILDSMTPNESITSLDGSSFWQSFIAST